MLSVKNCVWKFAVLYYMKRLAEKYRTESMVYVYGPDLMRYIFEIAASGILPMDSETLKEIEEYIAYMIPNGDIEPKVVLEQINADRMISRVLEALSVFFEPYVKEVLGE